jgi:ABC-type Fe3+ transport system substrate-binding protein
MNQFSVFAVSAALSLAAGAALAAEPSPALKEVIAAAQKEGRLELQWGADILGGRDAAREIADGMNKLYGTKIDVRFTAGPNLNDILNTVIVSAGANAASPTDIMIGSNQHASELYKKNISVPVDWAALLPGRIQADSIEAGGTALRIFTTFPAGIIYNTQQAPYAPTKLSDLLKPEWKGKIASTPYASGFDLMAATWGEEQTLDYARKLSTQIAGLIRCSELERVATGEFIGFAMDCLGTDWRELQRKGAPINHVIPADLAAQRFYYMAIPKHARSPAAAKLFIAFLSTPEGQKLAWKWGDSDLHTYPDGNMAKEFAEYDKKGVKFHQFTVDWYNEHPEALATLRKVVPILTQQR